jgi:anti-sigma28 factor (negative regulator of flagellin synthesis)
MTRDDGNSEVPPEIERLLASESEERKERIGRLREEIRSGRYGVDAQSVAEAIMRENTAQAGEDDG